MADRNISRVYINPNFKGFNRTTTVPHNNCMYVNPNFPQQLTSSHSSVLGNRIHVNPNFIKINNAIEINKQLNYNSDCVNREQTNNVVEIHRNDTQKLENVKPMPVSKSRYCLVRQNNENKIQAPEKVTKITTYKINKYKTVAIQNIKQSLNSIGSCKQNNVNQTNQQSLTPKFKNYGIPNLFESRFKIVKKIKVPETKIPVKRRLSNTNKHSLRLNLKPKVISRKQLKKNNIPCPLFRKYGKCLRNDNGKCEFLHDKRHISICRKFLNGVCCDDKCLLSHDVTLEKMPTCSFYLKGMCIKENCPYLHVKLNEKTKICNDFLKGYCEKGDKCNNRHINTCPEIAARGVCYKKQCTYPHKIDKRINQTKKIKNHTKSLNKSKQQCSTSLTRTNSIRKNIDKQELANSRYYKDVDEASTSDSIEVIKPTRCKLGDLPSFIQL